MKTLIIGAGEIGKSLKNVLSNYNPELIDKNSSIFGEYEIIHICFPYSEEFIDSVISYKKRFNPKFTIIHSTVPVGTSRKCGAIHSPVVGIHPNLTESLKTFTKFLGGENASEIADYFRRAGMKIYITNKSESTEFMKIQSTTLYSLQIEFYKETKEKCDELQIPFELFTLWNDNYNKGYEKLGYPEYKKPLLVPIMKRQGGKCTLPNLELIDTKFTKFLKEIA